MYYYQRKKIEMKIKDEVGHINFIHLNALDLGNFPGHGGKNSLPGFQVVTGNTLGVKDFNKKVGEILRTNI